MSCLLIKFSGLLNKSKFMKNNIRVLILIRDVDGVVPIQALFIGFIYLLIIELNTIKPFWPDYLIEFKIDIIGLTYC